jgi:hypothetical protein
MANRAKKTTIRLWITQGVLAALFLFAGAMKFIMPLDALQLPLPADLVRVVGASEILGALGLVFPGLVNVARGLTPVAATGLVMIMAGATAITVEGGALAPALIPLLVGALAVSVAYGRRGWLEPRGVDVADGSHGSQAVATLQGDGA